MEKRIYYHDTDAGGTHDRKDGRLILEAEVSLVCLNTEFKPAPIPDDLKEKLLS